MAIETTWSVNNMTHVDADGGVILAYWSLVAANDGGDERTAKVQAQIDRKAAQSDGLPWSA